MLTLGVHTINMWDKCLFLSTSANDYNYSSCENDNGIYIYSHDVLYLYNKHTMAHR